MSETRKTRLILPVAWTALLLAGYVGAYYSLVGVTFVATDPMTSDPTYAIDDWADRFFGSSSLRSTG